MDIENIIRRLVVGQTIIIQLEEDMVIGELIVKKWPSHIRIRNCQDYKTNEDLGVNNIYYINEIRDIRLCPESKKEKQHEDETTTILEEQTDEEALQTHKKICIKLDDETWHKIRDKLNSRIYIKQYDATYFNACKEMLSQHQIGIRFEDVRFGRLSDVSILAVSTDKHIYIFDLLFLNGIKKELKAVFESKTVCKIIHYSKMTYDYLKHACNIKTRFVFDPLMAYFYVSGTRDVLTINDLIATIFNFPQMELSKDVLWDSRPITEDVLSQAAYSVAFLIEIQQFLTHRHLLRRFYEASSKAMHYHSYENEYPYDIKFIKRKEFVKNLVFDDSDDSPIDLRETQEPDAIEEKEETESQCVASN